MNKRTNELLLYATTWMNLNNLAFLDTSQTWKSTNYMTGLIYKVQNRQITQRVRSQDGGYSQEGR